MKRCENVVALAIGREMATNEGKTLQLPERPLSTGSSRELRDKKQQQQQHVTRSASTPSKHYPKRNVKFDSYENGDCSMLEAVRPTDTGSDSETTKNGVRDFRDFFTQRWRVNSRKSSTCSTLISGRTEDTRGSLDSDIFSEEEENTHIHIDHEWTMEDERKFNEVFMALDRNRDGVLTFNELKDGAQLFGWNPTGTDISQYLGDMDRDGDEKVTKSEFRMYLQDLLSKLDHPVKVLEDSIDVMMRAIDTDGNGLCSKEEFRVFIQERGESPLTDADVDELFQQFDSDGDKTTLNKSELFRLLTEGMDLLV